MLTIVVSFSMMLNLRERLAIICIQADAAIGRSPPGMPKRNLLLTPEELAQTSSITLHHYNQDTESFWQSTKDHDVSQNRNTLIEHLVGEGPFRILDFGCGPGRDLKAFKELGYEVIGLEGAERSVEMAGTYSSCEVWQQEF